MRNIPTSFGKHALMVALLAGSGILVASSFAMPGAGPASGQPGCAARGGEQFQSRRQAFHAQRLAGLKDKLKLKPEQEAAWQAFASASQPVGKGMDRQAMRDEFGKLNAPQRMDRMLVLTDQRRARLVQRAETVKQFYAQLNPEQQSVFDREAMLFRHGKHRHAGGRGQQS